MIDPIRGIEFDGTITSAEPTPLPRRIVDWIEAETKKKVDATVSDYTRHHGHPPTDAEREQIRAEAESEARERVEVLRGRRRRKREDGAQGDC